MYGMSSVTYSGSSVLLSPLQCRENRNKKVEFVMEVGGTPSGNKESIISLRFDYESLKRLQRHINERISLIEQTMVHKRDFVNTLQHWGDESSCGVKNFRLGQLQLALTRSSPLDLEVDAWINFTNKTLSLDASNIGHILSLKDYETISCACVNIGETRIGGIYETHAGCWKAPRILHVPVLEKYLPDYPKILGRHRFSEAICKDVFSNLFAYCNDNKVKSLAIPFEPYEDLNFIRFLDIINILGNFTEEKDVKIYFWLCYKFNWAVNDFNRMCGMK